MFNRIMSLTGASLTTAGILLRFIDVAMWVSALVALTGVGVTVAAAVIAYRYAIKKILWTAGRYAAIQL